MRVFTRVAAVGSMAGAGRDMRISQTMVTKHIDAIEARLGVKLLHRTTRRLTLTEAGRAYLDACGRILAEIDEAEQEAIVGQSEPRGQLRLNAPVSFGTLQVAPLLPAFAERFPKVTVDLGLNDRIVDLVEEGWDLAIRIGLLADSSLVSRRLAPCDTVVCASPAYLATHGRPRTLADLADHNCLGYTLSTRLGSKAWSFGGDGAIRIPISGNLQANNGDALRAAAVAGMGLIYQPSFLVADDLQSGTLEALAFDHPTMPVGHIHAVFPPDRRMPLKVRAMIDFLADRLKPPP